MERSSEETQVTKRTGRGHPGTARPRPLVRAAWLASLQCRGSQKKPRFLKSEVEIYRSSRRRRQVYKVLPRSSATAGQGRNIPADTQARLRAEGGTERAWATHELVALLQPAPHSPEASSKEDPRPAPSHAPRGLPAARSGVQDEGASLTGTASLPAAEKGPPLKGTGPSAFPGRRRQPASTLLVAWPLASHMAPPDPDGQERTSPTGEGGQGHWHGPRAGRPGIPRLPRIPAGSRPPAACVWWGRGAPCLNDNSDQIHCTVALPAAPTTPPPRLLADPAGPKVLAERPARRLP